MGLAVLLELGHATDRKLRRSLFPLALFGIVHGAHEWLEMFLNLGMLPGQDSLPVFWTAFRIVILAVSFLPLAACGASLIRYDDQWQRISLVIPLSMATVWAFGLFILRGLYPFSSLMIVSDVWSRYILAIPAALLTSIGLIMLQRRFRQQGMARFGRDSLWAAIAFFWYGLIGQLFVQAGPLPPSTVLNQELFLQLFGFPVQLLRAVAAVVAALFVMRFLRSFEVERQAQIIELQAARLEEAQRRENLRGQLLNRIVMAQEAERQRIARELHDETGQSLTAIGLGLRGVSSNLRLDVDRSALNLRQLEGLVAHSLTELQRLISDLRPSHLDDLGLSATLRWYVGEVQDRTDLKINLDIQGDDAILSGEAKIAIFRIAQEALNNVVRHANAKLVNIQVRYDQDVALMHVDDDGCGFDLQEIEKRDRRPWGLTGIQERTSLLGGTSVILSEPGYGTLIEITVPINAQGEQEV